MAEEIVVKFQKFIDVLRTKAEKLTEEEQKYISNLDDFFLPCQLMIFIFGNLPTKHLIVTHDENRADREIELYRIETWDAVNELEKISNYLRWDREFTEEEKQGFWRVDNYKELIEGQLIFFINSMENSLYLKPREKFIGGKSMLHKRDFTWTVYDETTFDPEKEAIKIVEGAIKQHIAEKDKKPHIESTKPTTIPEGINGYGSYFYLPVWVNEYPALSFREKIRGTRASFSFQKKSITDTYRGFTTIIEENGYIGICMEDRQTANRYLNEIMGTGLLFGLPFFSVRDGEMSEFGLQKDTTKIGSRQIIPRGNLLRQFDRNKGYWETDIHPHLSIKEEGFRKLLKMAEMITNESEVSDCIMLFVESYTSLQSSQYIQSFIVSWTIIEKYLYWLWGTHLKNLGVNRERRDRLTGSEWTISRVVEMLEITNLITNDAYKVLTDLRKKRNDLIHGGEVIHKEEAKNCFEYSLHSLIHRTRAYAQYSEDALSKFIIHRYDPRDIRY